MPTGKGPARARNSWFKWHLILMCPQEIHRLPRSIAAKVVFKSEIDDQSSTQNQHQQQCPAPWRPDRRKLAHFGSDYQTEGRKHNRQREEPGCFIEKGPQRRLSRGPGVI